MQFVLALTLVAAAPSPDTELRAAASFMTTLVDSGAYNEADLQFVRFFTSYSLPTNKQIELENKSISYREASWHALSFCLNSCAKYNSSGFIEPPRRVPNSDTLMWIDIRDYGWNPDQWEKISLQDPYFAEPLVNHRVATYLNLIAGNVIFRTDWFIVHSLDAMQQIDEGIEDVIYYRLLYDDETPETLEEYQKLWQIDIEKIREVLKIERQGVVDYGDSGVSRHNRMVLGSRTELGYYWETQDSKVEDYIENIFSPEKDAGEIISSHRNGLQVYLLVNGQNKRVDFADNALVVDHSDAQDVRVRTAKSCIICHAGGINPIDDEISNMIENGVKLFADKEFELKIKRAYLSGLDSKIKADNLLYEEAVRQCNGLSGVDNTTVFHTLYKWYLKDLDLEQAAAEIGLSVEEFKRKVSLTISGRLAALIQYGKPLPRQYWEQLENGGYTQAMLQVKQIKIEQVEGEAGVETIKYCAMMSGKEILAYCNQGEQFKIISRQGDWFLVERNGIKGYLNTEVVKEILLEDEN